MSEFMNSTIISPGRELNIFRAEDCQTNRTVGNY